MVETRMIDDNSVFDIIRRHQLQPPVDVYRLAQSLGLSVSEKGLGPDVGGKIVRRGGVLSPSNYEIVVNKEDHIRRRRFTVAHEIAHFILHRDMIGDGFVEDAMYRGPFGGRAEVQANKLAADILMPYFLIEKEWHRGVRDQITLARQFEVSPKAMEIRLDGFRRDRQSHR